jgi:hypothetical protein
MVCDRSFRLVLHGHIVVALGTLCRRPKIGIADLAVALLAFGCPGVTFHFVATLRALMIGVATLL